MPCSRARPIRHVSDLLDAAKLEAGRMQAHYARFDLSAFARVTAAQFESMAHEHEIAFEVEAPGSLEVEADSAMVQRVIINLLANAIKFTPAGGGTQFRVDAEEGWAILEVADNGPGIPETMREAVFERFRQVDSGTQRAHGGTGLGLAIVKDFVALHQGAVGVSPAPGGGALFTVRLPLRAPAGTAIDTVAEEVDPVVLASVEDEFRPSDPSGHETDPGGTAADTPLVLVVEDNADLNRFIADALRLSLFEMGVQGYLNKPFSVDELLAHVNAVVRSRKRALDELRRLNYFDSLTKLLHRLQPTGTPSG